MSAEIIIRQAVLGDLKALVEFNCAMARETEGTALDPHRVTAGVRGLFEQPQRGFYLVAEQSGHVVGALMITSEWSDWRNGLFWWIQSVYVPRDWRRQGIFRRLYQHVQQCARRDPQICGLRLYVDCNNGAAQQTYAAMGMTETAYRLYQRLNTDSPSVATG
jgi:GNAT superfamily N-acetyltransferase